ncbi:hypothetical protein HanIR_Chr09g0427791 [Helianthus annuus]|nr:hypothetical protein HanIR_Chr09g0427791 [Helianthus annuus]
MSLWCCVSLESESLGHYIYTWIPLSLTNLKIIDDRWILSGLNPSRVNSKK